MSRPATLSALLVFVALSACHDTRSTRIELRTPGSNLDCFETADRVFSAEGFAASAEACGVNRFYSKTAGPLAPGWGIAVSIHRRSKNDGWGDCGFDIEAMSANESGGMRCPPTPTAGSVFKDITRRMARLLDEAFRGKPPS